VAGLYYAQDEVGVARDREARHVALVTFCQIVGAGLLLSACQSTQQSVQSKEDPLAAAGFTIKPADTPARLSAMKKLPPLKFVLQTNGEERRLGLCRSDDLPMRVFRGSGRLVELSRHGIFAKQLANEQQMTAVMNQNAFDFGPWRSQAISSAPFSVRTV
jgi:hypothetical protein